MAYTIRCSDPWHEDRKDQEGWSDNLGHSTQEVKVSLCKACSKARSLEAFPADMYIELQGDTARIRIAKRYITGEIVGHQEVLLNLQEALSSRQKRKLDKLRGQLAAYALKPKG